MMIRESVKSVLKRVVSEPTRRGLKSTSRRATYVANARIASPLHKFILNPLNGRRHALRDKRYLEIGPGPERIPEFETLNVISGRNVDYVGNAAKRLPFPDCIFDVVYASHILEHIPWYQVTAAINEWARVLKVGGALEIWTPDGLKISKAFVEAEELGSTDFQQDGWWRFNEEKDPCRWAAGRCFSYGDGTGASTHPNWHRSLFSARYLEKAFHEAGLTDIRRMDRSEVRGYDHGWINLGMRGVKQPPDHLLAS